MNNAKFQVFAAEYERRVAGLTEQQQSVQRQQKLLEVEGVFLT